MNDSDGEPSHPAAPGPDEHLEERATGDSVRLDCEQVQRVRSLGIRLHGEDTLDAILDRALEAFAEVTGAGRTIITLIGDERPVLRGRGISTEVAAEIVVPLKRGEAAGSGDISAVLRSGEPALTPVDDSRRSEFAVPGFGEYTHSLTVPLIGHSGVDGTLTAAWSQPTAPDGAVVQLAMILADHVAAAIEAQRRVDAERRERVVAEELHTVAQRITAGLSLDDGLSSVLRAVEKLLEAASASIFLAGPDGAIANRRFTTRNTGEPHWDDHTHTRPNGITASVLQTGQPSIVEDAWIDQRTQGVDRGDNRSFVAVPIRHDNRTVGVLYVNWRDRRQFHARDLRLIETLAVYGAVAVENARLHQEEIAAARYDGVVLAARTVAHEINNDLALTMGMAEIAQMQVRAGQFPDPSILDDVLQGAQRIAKHVRQLQGVVRVEERRVRDLPPLLDLGNSVE